MSKVAQLRALSKNAKEVEPILLVAAVIIGGYVIYKMYQGVKKGVELVGQGANNTLDLVGAGTQGKRAQATLDSLDSLADEDNPFKTDYLDKVRRDAKTGEVVHYIKAADKVKLYKYITELLSLLTTYKHPLSYEENRKKAVKAIKDIITHKSQISHLQAYFKEQGSDLLKTLDDGFRHTGWTSGSEYEKMFADLINYLLKLPK